MIPTLKSAHPAKAVPRPPASHLLPSSTRVDAPEQESRIPLIEWETILGDPPPAEQDGPGWQTVHVPHNWEDYHGYHVHSHGNLHGTAWYRTTFNWHPHFPEERLFAMFEGVGSYARVLCNEIEVGQHVGGRTSFTVDLTATLRPGLNRLSVRAHHPEGIDDMPFVCGGCWGSPNTEGSQPFGMFRPAWLERTGPARVEPFGVHVLTPVVNDKQALIEVRTEVINRGNQTLPLIVRTVILAPDGTPCLTGELPLTLPSGNLQTITQTFPPLSQPQLWGPGHAHLYRAETTILEQDRISHRTVTSFGLRWIQWPVINSPNADRNVRSADARGQLISTGETPRTPENNGLTTILKRAAATQAQLAPMGATVHIDPVGLPDIASLTVDLQVKGTTDEVDVFCEIQNEGGTVFLHQHQVRLTLKDGAAVHQWKVPAVHLPHLWSPDDPYLHKLVVTLRSPQEDLWEESETLFGIRDINQPLNLNRPVFSQASPTAHSATRTETKSLRLNGKPLFLNGTCEYENLLGNDHAFTDAQITASVAMMRSAGFNAFRDAHHPHNLRYYDLWDQHGIVCWTQLGSHIWFDTPRFRSNFRTIVTEWVRERRNHPCILIWGLQNESILPTDFAREMRDLIRKLDPSSPLERIVTTCNGGTGTDWNVPQDWCGTYGGNCNDYDLESSQLVGEYGAWRSFGVHTESNYRGDENDRSETWACYAMETKIRRGEMVRDRAIGHFHWIFNSFPNPGRTAENYEGPGNGQIGPVNFKGLVTAWHQPSDLYYLFRANYADPQREPMVYIVSHTWPDRWKKQLPHTVHVFSNCDEVELFNGIGVRSLGVRQQPGRGNHFTWIGILPETNVLFAVARRGGREVAHDIITLDHLPTDDSLDRWLKAGTFTAQSLPTPSSTSPALYRVSCGATSDYTDATGRTWLADRQWKQGASWGWSSWAEQFENVPAELGSCGQTITPVRGTIAPELYRTYRYGRHHLRYHFSTTPGRYRLRLHFTEPWFGVGGGSDCRNWRLFDIAVNGETIEHDLDIWKESGGDHRALIREYTVTSKNAGLSVHFPFVRVNQAVISAIEVESVAG